MSARFYRTTASFLIALTSYWLYALAAVPWIEPLAQESRPPVQLTEQPGETAESPIDPFRSLLAPLFAADRWERRDAKILKNRQFMLLLRDYQTIENGRQLQLRPCTIVFNPDAAGNHGDKSNTPRCLILQAPEGAVLEFDRPLDLTRGGLGQLISGRLVGEVTIRSQPSAPHATDGIRVVTRNVQITSRQIWTSQNVHFRYGRNSGSGRDLMINLAEAESSDIRRLPHEASTRLRSLELVHLDHMELAVDGSLWESRSGREPDSRRRTNGPTAAPILLQVECDGPLLFDFVGGSVTLKTGVVIQRVNQEGRPDRLTCELLALQFRSRNPAPPVNAATASDEESWDLPELELSQIDALGHPALLDAPSHSLRAQAERLELQISHNRVLLQDGEQAVLKYDVHTLRAPRLRYHFDPDGGLGRAEIDGAGNYEGQLRDNAVEVSWTKRLDFRPHDGRYLLSVDGDTSVRWAQDHQITANTLQLWLRAVTSGQNAGLSAAPKKTGPDPTNRGATSMGDWQPDRIVAKQAVRLRSPQLLGRTEFADVRLIDGDAARPGSPPAGPTVLDGPLGPRDARKTAPATPRRFGLRGREIHVVMRAGNSTPELQSVVISGEVDLRELIDDASALPIEISGDHVQLDQQNAVGESALVRITGEPAVIRTRGVEVSGRNIRLDQLRNRIWIDGAGAAYIPLPDGIAAQFARRRATAQIAWNGAMEFDGQSVTCERAVEIRGPAQIAKADALQVTLSEPIRLQRNSTVTAGLQAGSASLSSRSVLAEITLSGHTWLENRTFDDNGLASIDELSLESLTYRQQTGELIGLGPGWLSTVRFTRAAALGPPNVHQQPSLSHTLVEFQQQLLGNMQTREISVFDNVRAIHGPVEHWQERLLLDNLAGPTQDSVLMRCARLTVAQMGAAQSQREPSLEFVASGNTEIEGRTFVAQAQNIRYAQANGLLVMEGNGRSVARLRYQNRIGGPLQKAAARKIQYWIRENRASADGVVFGDFDLGP